MAYVDAAGTNNAGCSRATPCNTMAAALATNRGTIKVTGTIDEAVTIDGTRAVAIYGAPGAKLTRTANGGLLRINDAAQVAIFDLEITGALGTNPGISVPVGSTATVSLTRSTVSNNAGGGVSASGGTVSVARSTIVGNTGGGISINGAQFDIVNNFIVQNGGPTSLNGGVNIATATGSGSHRLDFNTIAANVGTSSVNSGVNCGTVGAPIAFSSNIIYGNSVSGGGKQLGGSSNCTTVYSDIGPDTLAGTGNIDQDPMFVDPAHSDFHIAAGSPAKDAADPAATLAIDIDGDTRPQGNGRDIGADEVP